jgi:hypothetical protein
MVGVGVFVFGPDHPEILAIITQKALATLSAPIAFKCPPSSVYEPFIASYSPFLTIPPSLSMAAISKRILLFACVKLRT